MINNFKEAIVVEGVVDITSDRPNSSKVGSSVRPFTTAKSFYENKDVRSDTQ